MVRGWKSNGIHDVGSSHRFDKFANPFDEWEAWTARSIVQFRVEVSTSHLLRL